MNPGPLNSSNDSIPSSLIRGENDKTLTGCQEKVGWNPLLMFFDDVHNIGHSELKLTTLEFRSHLGKTLEQDFSYLIYLGLGYNQGRRDHDMVAIFPIYHPAS